MPNELCLPFSLSGFAARYICFGIAMALVWWAMPRYKAAEEARSEGGKVKFFAVIILSLFFVTAGTFFK